MNFLWNTHSLQKAFKRFDLIYIIVVDVYIYIYIYLYIRIVVKEWCKTLACSILIFPVNDNVGGG